MSARENHIDDWLNRAFQLAFFLHNDREVAKQIALNAMAKLETASTAQFKRYYYTPTGRAESARATRSRVSLNDLQLLQRLVFVESENFEREKEEQKQAGERSLLTYFIKHLVRISLKRNSFYVTLGISRILHNYATGEAMEIYNVVVQDPDRVHDDYYYRSRKGVLMKELKARFGDLIDVVRGHRGEERFETHANGAELAETVKDALKTFTPWNSSCALPDKFDPTDDVIKPFYFDRDDPDAEHRIEINRIHATLHPHCFDRLTNALNLPSPVEKMEIPKFMITQDPSDFNDNDWQNPSSLEFDELETIKGVLSAQAEGRRAMSANLLRVRVDGEERANFDLRETAGIEFQADETAELIEILAVGSTGETTLATHLLSFDELQKGNANHTVTSEAGQKITFNLRPTIDSYGDVSNISCGISYQETAFRRAAALAISRKLFAAQRLFSDAAWILKPAMAMGVILLAVSVAWVLYRNNSNTVQITTNGPEPVKNPGFAAPPEPKQTAPVDEQKPDVKQFAQQREPKQEPNRRVNNATIQAANNRKEKQDAALPPKTLVANNVEHKNYREFTDENGILRLPIRQSGNEFDRVKNATRGEKKFIGKSFADIKKVFIEISGDHVLGEIVRRDVASEIGKSERFDITTDRDSADAVLKIFIRHESDGDKREDATITAIVRLVNEEGFIVYPTVKRVAGWKYVGTIQKTPARIAADLLKGQKHDR